MPETQKTTSTSSTAKPTEPSAPSGEVGTSLGQDEVQGKVDEETEKGYRGYTEDKGDYSVGGSVAGKNTPDGKPA